MNTKLVPVLGVLFVAIFVAAAASLYFGLPSRLQNARSHTTADQAYTCPMHPEVVQNHAGQCPQCGMALTIASAPAKTSHADCAHEGTTDTCCPKPATTPVRLPPGHPPIPVQLPPGHPPVNGFTTNEVSRAGGEPVDLLER